MIHIEETKDYKLIATLNEEVQNLHHHIEPTMFKPFNQEKVELAFKEILEDGVKAFVAFFKEEKVGYILLRSIELEENAFKYYIRKLSIDHICVVESYRKHGIGKALVDFSKEYARSLDLKRIEMNYWTQNENSGQFFRAQGFSNFNERLCFEIE